MLVPIATDPNRDLKLALGLAASGALALTPLALPANALTRSIFPVAAITGSIASIAKTNIYEAQEKLEADSKERWDALRTDMDDSLLVSSQAFYTANPGAYLQRQAVPIQWHTQYLNARFSPLPELPQSQFEPIAQVQPQSQTVTSHREPGMVRGGSFDVDDDFAPTFTAPIAPVSHQSFTLDRDPDDAWLDRLIAPSVLLVFGGDGSGKTSMALELLRRRQNAGHQTIALDPHASPDKWPGCDVVGAGLNFLKIESAIDSLMAIIKSRYEQIGSGEIAPCGFPPITFVLEEMTDWKASVSNAALLILKAGDYRKVNVHLLMVSHGDSLGQIGAPDGSSEVVKNVFTKLRLYSKPGDGGQPIPALRGELQYPLQAVQAVQVPKLSPPPRQTPEALSMASFEPSPPPLLHASESPASRPEAPKIAPSPQPEASSDREAELLAQFSEMKAMGMNKKQICYAIWGAKMGGTDRYRMASDFYDRLNSKYSELSGESAA